MSALRTLLQDYLTMRRALGYKLRSDGASLSSFVSFILKPQLNKNIKSVRLVFFELNHDFTSQSYSPNG